MFNISALVCTSCTPGVQENAAISLVELQSADILCLIICSEYYAVVTHRKCIAKHIINHRIYADWSAMTSSSCTRRVQEVHTKAEVVHLSPVLLGLWILFNCHS